MLPVDWAQMGLNGAIADPLPPNGACSYVTHPALLSQLVHNMKLWQQCHFYDPILELGPAEPNCGVLAAAVTIIEVPLLLSQTHTHICSCTYVTKSTRTHAHTRVHMRTHAHTTRLAHSHRLWASGFMECEEQLHFFFFYAWLRQTVFEAGWSLCFIFSCSLEHISAFLFDGWDMAGT